MHENPAWSTRKTVLITGANGFIGRNLSAAIRARGHVVKEFNKSAGKDIMNGALLEREIAGCDMVFHLAAQVDEYAKDLFDVNVNGTKNVLDACEKNHVKRLVYLSTCGVMGDTEGIADESAKYNPKTRYEKSKAEAEKLVLKYLETIPITIVRPTLVYGVNGYWQGIVKHVIKGWPLPGSGKNTFQVVYVKDLVDALVFLANNEDAIGQTYIISSDGNESVNQIYREISDALGTKKEPWHIPAFIAKFIATIFPNKLITPEHIDRLNRERKYSIEKIRKLGWRPRYGFHTGIRETIFEMKKNQMI